MIEPELRRTLIPSYEQRGGAESGLMRDVDGTTVAVRDDGQTRRRDQESLCERLRSACKHRITDRLVTENPKALQCRAPPIRQPTTTQPSLRKFGIGIAAEETEEACRFLSFLGVLMFPSIHATPPRPSSGT